MSDFYNQGAVPLDSAAYIPRGFEQKVFDEIEDVVQQEQVYNT